jgi:hypothetical protein
MIQSIRSEYWLDEQGNKRPRKYLTKLERMQESEIGKILKRAEFLNEKLSEFKEAVASSCEKLVEEYAKRNKLDTTNWKGNITLMSFDRSVKIELNVNNRIEFDDLAIKACKALLDEFLSENIDAKNAFIAEIVTDAFSTSRGKLDTKKVLGLLKYESKIKDEKFQKAMGFLKESIRNVGSKNYYRISVKDDDGSWEPIRLDFSSL